MLLECSIFRFKGVVKSLEQRNDLTCRCKNAMMIQWVSLHLVNLIHELSYVK